MSLTVTDQQTVAGIGATVTAATILTGSVAQDLSDSISNGASDQVVIVTFTVAQLKLFFLLSDQNLTVKFYEDVAGTPTLRDTVTLPQNVPINYIPGAIGGVTPCPNVVTALLYMKVTNASGNAASLVGKILEDATP
jgi:hypothetical protein